LDKQSRDHAPIEIAGSDPTREHPFLIPMVDKQLRSSFLSIIPSKYGKILLMKFNWKIFVFLAFLVFIVYFNSLGNDFVSDDIAAIKNNPNIDNVSYIFQQPFFNINPRSLTISLTNKVFGLNPVFYRLPNILFHLGSVWIIYILIGLFFKSPVPFFTASLFAVHPILIEGVTWISGGPYSNGTFFALLAFLLYLLFNQNREKKFYLFSLLSFIIAFFFCEKLIVLPIIFLVYDLCFGKIKNNWQQLISFFILGSLFALKLMGLLGERIVSLATNYYQQPGFENPLVQIPVAITSYLKLIFIPFGFTLYHSEEMIFSTTTFIIRFIISLVFLFILVLSFKKERKIFFWLLFFFISLLPVLTPFKISWIVAERYVYFGSLGIFVLIAVVIQKIGDLSKNQKVSYLIFCVIIFVLGILTITRNADWKNQDTLWLAAAKTSPSSAQNHNNLGDYYGRQRNFQKAIEEFTIATKLMPNYGDAYHNLASVYYQTKEYNKALENYQKAIATNPNLWQSYQNIASVYFDLKQYPLALDNTKKAILINPQNSSLHTILGITYLQTNQKSEAKIEFQKAISLDPQNQRAKQLLLSL